MKSVTTVRWRNPELLLFHPNSHKLLPTTREQNQATLTAPALFWERGKKAQLGWKRRKAGTY